MSSILTFNQLQNLPANFSSVETAVASVNAIGGTTGAASTTRAVLGLSNDVAGGLFDGQPFKVRVVAQGVASGAGNFVVNLYWNSTANTNLTTFTSDILVVGSGNQALSSKSAVLYMEAICIWDSTLQQLGAFQMAPSGFANVLTTPLMIPTAGTAAKSNTSGVVATAQANQSLIQFFVTTSISANGTSAKLLELALDQI